MFSIDECWLLVAWLDYRAETANTEHTGRYGHMVPCHAHAIDTVIPVLGHAQSPLSQGLRGGIQCEYMAIIDNSSDTARYSDIAIMMNTDTYPYVLRCVPTMP